MHVSKVIKFERALIEKMLFVGGYKSIKNTLIYIDLDVACYPKSNDNYVSTVARTEQEICSCIESGFEYVCDFSGSQDLQETKVSGIKNFTICPKVSRFGRVAHLKFSEWLQDELTQPQWLFQLCICRPC